MGQQLSFVHLRYFAAPGPDAEPGISILVVSTAGAIEVIVHPDWKRHVDPRDHEYVELMVRTWQKRTQNEAPGLMEDLAEMALGPLRAVDSGPITPEKRSALISQVLAA